MTLGTETLVIAPDYYRYIVKIHYFIEKSSLVSAVVAQLVHMQERSPRMRKVDSSKPDGDKPSIRKSLNQVLKVPVSNPWQQK